MKGLKAEDLRTWTPADLTSRIAELEEERFRLTFRSATEQLEEPLRLRAIRKDVARLKTVLNEKTRERETVKPKAGRTAK
ncbi:MAG TPA: 50S ribosomal protein L29 [Gemmatimonadaceae bacterium]|nr:50S ribosomal protein L29 [Gemmatimonadaceae bacterium]